jgi:hypothetical protein
MPHSRPSLRVDSLEIETRPVAPVIEGLVIRFTHWLIAVGKGHGDPSPMLVGLSDYQPIVTSRRNAPQRFIRPIHQCLVIIGRAYV